MKFSTQSPPAATDRTVSKAELELDRLPTWSGERETSSPVAGIRKSGRQRNWYQISAAWFRWIHIYVSMLSFAALFFFAVTGITLNHPTWLGAGDQQLRDEVGVLDANWLRGETVNELQIAEALRATHRLKGRVAEFQTDEFECMVVFKGPGYSADAFIDRESGNYTLTETTTGFVAVLNDLHKGRDSGVAWAWVIDISALVMIVMSLSGFGLLFYLKKRRASGVLTAVAGTILMIVAWAMWVP